MTLTHFAIIAVCAYLLGSLSFAIIVSKLTLGKDIRNYGSGNAGLTNAYRTMGAKKTLLVLLGDIAKGAAAVSIGMVLAGPVGKLTAGIFVILGHMFPLYFGFKGGKGVLVGAVMLAFFDWRVFGIAFLLFVLAVAHRDQMDLARLDPGRGQLSHHYLGILSRPGADRDGARHGGGRRIHAPLEYRTHHPRKGKQIFLQEQENHV